jgi:hypothetical protein
VFFLLLLLLLFGLRRAARQELQRLESAVGKSERMAGAVLSDLRSMRQNPRATELRSEVGSNNTTRWHTTWYRKQFLQLSLQHAWPAL